MQTISLSGTTSSLTTLNYSSELHHLRNLKQRRSFSSISKISNDEIPILPSSPSSLHSPGLCKASQVAELFPSSASRDIVVVREARMEDCWEVAETHCSSFFPRYSFPLALLLRLNRFVGMLLRSSNPAEGCRRACLVAVIGGTFDGKFSLRNNGCVAGILTVDTMADFLPRKGPLRQRRTGIAYISNVAVRDECRRKGIAKKMVAEAEAMAKSWGCRAIALHCDLENHGAIGLYSSQGFKTVKVPEAADWPRPRAARDVRYNFMMKLVARCSL